MKKYISPWGIQCKVQMVAQDKTLKEVAKATGYTHTYVSAIINGRIKAPENTIAKISDELGVSIELPH